MVFCTVEPAILVMLVLMDLMVWTYTLFKEYVNYRAIKGIAERLTAVSSLTSSHLFLLFHTHVKYFVLHLFMWRQVMIWCLHACGLLLLHEYFQWSVNWFDFVGKPTRINTCVCHYASVCFLAYIPCHLNWSWSKNWLFEKAAWTFQPYFILLHFYYPLAWAWMKIPHKI